MADFKIAAAQVASVRGAIERNIETHATAIGTAAAQRVSLLVFPELSLTGYEPDQAADLAIAPTDERLEPLRTLARRHRIDAVVGAPLREGSGKPKLGAVVIRRNGETEVYHKMHLGGGEPDFFEPGDEPLVLTVDGCTVGLAICADSSRTTHPEAYAGSGAQVYAAGVFLTAEWYRTDVPRLTAYAEVHRMLIVMANQAASVGSRASVGKSAIWSPEGRLLVRAAGTENVLLIAAHTDGVWRGDAVAL